MAAITARAALDGRSSTRGPWRWRAAQATFEETAVFCVKFGQAGVEQLALGNDDDVEPCRDLVATENLSNQSFSTIPLDRATELLRGGDAQPPVRGLIGQDEQRAVAAVDANALSVYELVFRTPTDPLLGPQPRHAYSLLTVSRLRPFARRRLRTSRPFFVLMRTRNPWVRLRCRVLG